MAPQRPRRPLALLLLAFLLLACAPLPRLFLAPAGAVSPEPGVTPLVEGYDLRPPNLQLPPGKRSLLDPVLPPRQVDEPADAQAAVTSFLTKLIANTQPVDLFTALLFFVALSLGVIDTPRRWLDYASEELGWFLHGRDKAAVVPGRRVAGGRQDVERAEAACTEVRRLAEFLESAKPADQLRALSAADAVGKRQKGGLEPLLAALREAAGAASLAPGEELPSLDGEWECLCDYFGSGELVQAPMSIAGSEGEYRAGGGTHRLFGIGTRRAGSVLSVNFRWRNEGGASGRGTWLLTADGECIDGRWWQDGSLDGPWIWTGMKRRPDEPSAMVGRAPPSRTDAGVAAAAAVADAAAEVVRSAVQEPPAKREPLASAWDAATPERFVGGDYSQSAVLPRLWKAAGTELRLLLGLTYSELVPSSVSTLAKGATIAFLALLCFLLARGLSIGLGSSSDAATWATFAAFAAVVLDLTVPSRREDLRSALRSPGQEALRSRRLAALRSWADSGKLLRSGSSLRDDVLEAVRRGVPEFRMKLEEEDSVPTDGEVEQLLKIWHPGLKRKVLRGLAAVQARKLEEDFSPAVITYKNLSLSEGGGSVWR